MEMKRGREAAAIAYCTHKKHALAPPQQPTTFRRTRRSELMLYGASFLIRLMLIVYAEWQDAHLAVKYSDVDYEVFTDAARHVWHGDSPYLRHTYRYTPLLAYTVLPNLWVKWFGKVLFAVVDLLVGYILRVVLTARGCPPSRMLVLLALWLMNPVVIQVSTRGNADSIPVLLCLLVLLCLRRKRSLLAGLWLGLAVHVKIYPIIMLLPCFLYINQNQKYLARRRTKRFFWQFKITQVSREQVVFGASFGISLFILQCFFYAIYGWNFLYAGYLYHLIRVDHRHNFAPFFYPLYLTHDLQTFRKVLSFVGFVSQKKPLFCGGYFGSSSSSTSILFLQLFQWFPTLWLGCTRARNDLEWAVFLQILCFVVFNKVCTVQYFVWWFGLLPIAAEFALRSHGRRRRRRFWRFFGATLLLWASAQAMWLYWAYRLEFLGESVFTQVYVSSLLFFGAQVTLLLFFTSFNGTSEGKLE